MGEGDVTSGEWGELRRERLCPTDDGVPPEDVPVEDVEGQAAEAAWDLAVEVFTIERAGGGGRPLTSLNLSTPTPCPSPNLQEACAPRCPSPMPRGPHAPPAPAAVTATAAAPWERVLGGVLGPMKCTPSLGTKRAHGQGSLRVHSARATEAMAGPLQGEMCTERTQLWKLCVGPGRSGLAPSEGLQRDSRQVCRGKCGSQQKRRACAARPKTEGVEQAVPTDPRHPQDGSTVPSKAQGKRVATPATSEEAGPGLWT